MLDNTPRTSSGIYLDADAEGELDSDVDREGAPDLEAETNGLPYSLRQRVKMNHAIPPPSKVSSCHLLPRIGEVVDRVAQVGKADMARDVVRQGQNSPGGCVCLPTTRCIWLFMPSFATDESCTGLGCAAVAH